MLFEISFGMHNFNISHVSSKGLTKKDYNRQLFMIIKIAIKCGIVVIISLRPMLHITQSSVFPELAPRTTDETDPWSFHGSASRLIRFQKAA